MAEGLYTTCASTDANYVAAGAFGLARLRSARGDVAGRRRRARPGAVHEPGLQRLPSAAGRRPGRPGRRPAAARAGPRQPRGRPARPARARPAHRRASSSGRWSGREAAAPPGTSGPPHGADRRAATPRSRTRCATGSRRPIVSSPAARTTRPAATPGSTGPTPYEGGPCDDRPPRPAPTCRPRAPRPAVAAGCEPRRRPSASRAASPLGRRRRRRRGRRCTAVEQDAPIELTRPTAADRARRPTAARARRALPVLRQRGRGGRLLHGLRDQGADPPRPLRRAARRAGSPRSATGGSSTTATRTRPPSPPTRSPARARCWSSATASPPPPTPTSPRWPPPGGPATSWSRCEPAGLPNPASRAGAIADAIENAVAQANEAVLAATPDGGPNAAACTFAGRRRRGRPGRVRQRR